MCLKIICDWITNRDIKKPNPLEKIDHSELYTILRAEFGDKCAIFLSDIDYWTTKTSEVKRFLRMDDTDKVRYQREIMDCDDFSYRLIGQFSVHGWSALPLGIIWVGIKENGHALNCFVDVDRKVWLIEPQNDKIFKIPKSWTPWLVVM